MKKDIRLTFMKPIQKGNNGFVKSKARIAINENDIETVISEAGNELIKDLLLEEKEIQKIIKQNFNKEMIISKKKNEKLNHVIYVTKSTKKEMSL